MADDPLEARIAELLADERYAGHPLREALEGLVARHREQLAQIERITSISDGFQTDLQLRHLSLHERFAKQVRQLGRIARISDRYQAMLRDLNERLRTLAVQDPLTGLPNRRFVLERLDDEAARAERAASTFSVALVDVDRFKAVNDAFGHEAGDRVLVAIARTLEAGLRPYDVCARWGGEEFLLLLPGTPGEAALEIAQRLRARVAAIRAPELPPSHPASVSIGVAEHAQGPVAQTLKRADAALYRAKRLGRNRVVLAGPGGA